MKNDYEAEIPYVQTEDGFFIHRPFLENCKRDFFADTVFSIVMCVVEGEGVEKKASLLLNNLCGGGGGVKRGGGSGGGGKRGEVEEEVASSANGGGEVGVYT